MANSIAVTIFYHTGHAENMGKRKPLNYSHGLRYALGCPAASRLGLIFFSALKIALNL